jgi:hypothetical protein
MAWQSKDLRKDTDKITIPRDSSPTHSLFQNVQLSLLLNVWYELLTPVLIMTNRQTIDYIPTLSAWIFCIIIFLIFFMSWYKSNVQLQS